jgi:hypothetical protein
MAESALGITDRMRGRSRTIGEAALSETSGMRPATLPGQAEKQLGQLTQQMESGVHQATLSGVQGTTQPAYDVLNDAIRNAPRNARFELLKIKRGRAGQNPKLASRVATE